VTHELRSRLARCIGQRRRCRRWWLPGLVLRLANLTNLVRSVAYSPDGWHIISRSDDIIIRTRMLRLVPQLAGLWRGTLTTIVCSPDNTSGPSVSLDFEDFACGTSRVQISLNVAVALLLLQFQTRASSSSFTQTRI